MRTLLFLLLFISLSFSTNAQSSWDYPRYPDNPIDYSSLVLKLEINPDEALVSGNVVYQGVVTLPGLNEVILSTRESSIQSVTRNGTALEFQILGDSLVISLDDTLNRGDELSFEISWQSETTFGFHKDRNDYMWSSTNPKSHRHWIPGFDHPRNHLQINASYTVPEEFTVIGNGDLVSNEVTLTEGKKTLQWITEGEIPFTTLSWVVGKFKLNEIRSGIKKIRYYSMDSDSITNLSEELADADEYLNVIESVVDQEYPFQSLNIVQLEEDFGSLNTLRASQILQTSSSDSSDFIRSLMDQWFGIQKSGETFWDYEQFIQPYQKFLSLSLPDQMETYDDLFDGENTSLKLEVIGELLKSSISAVLTPVGIYERLYSKYGIRIFGAPVQLIPETSFESMVELNPLKNTYLVQYDYDQVNGLLNMIFRSEGRLEDSLHTAKLTEYVFGDTLSTEFSFTGSLDTLKFEVSSSLEYATLNVEDTSLTILENKPLEFWLSQLRSEEAVLRVQAAEGLKAYKDEPDIQLALNDILSSENNAVVQAAIYGTLSEITDSDIGTEQSFLGILNSEDPELQLAAIQALAKFEGNEEVVYALRNKVLRAEDEGIEFEAFNAFLTTADSADTISLIDRLLRTKSDTKSLVYYIKDSGVNVSDLAVAERLIPFISKEYSSEIRIMVVEMLMTLEAEDVDWVLIVSELINDANPLIRQVAIGLFDRIEVEKQNEFIEELRMNEFDFRVLEALK